jgi:hypothetical protein
MRQDTQARGRITGIGHTKNTNRGGKQFSNGVMIYCEGVRGTEAAGWEDGVPSCDCGVACTNMLAYALDQP